MAPIKIQHIVSFSSEDVNYPAENLLKIHHKWRCKTAGEKQAYVVLQLEKATQISSIDIGNEGSAFVEVLVGRSGAPEQDYQVLLVASSFMRPIEARTGKSKGRVRMFETDKLCAATREEKWDRVKVICSQPFNKNLQYGLAFINFNSSADKEGKGSTVKTEDSGAVKLGAFTVKEDEPQTLSVGSYFAKQKGKTECTSLTGAAAVRASCGLAAAVLAQTENEVKAAVKRKSEESLKNPPEKTMYQLKKENYIGKAEKVTQKQRTNGESCDTPVTKAARYGSPAQQSTRDSWSQGSPSGGHMQKKDSNKATKKTEVAGKVKLNPEAKVKLNEKPKHTKSFNRLLEDVSFVISGYQNPLRGEVRDKAMAMGAKYKSDWDDSCTHLICAFINTPKFKAVKGKGKIVKKEWVEACYTKQCRVPWRRYCLDKSDQGEESEEEIWAKELFPQSPKNAKDVNKKAEADDEDSDEYGGDTDVDENNRSDSDTEDEIQRVKMEQMPSSVPDPYDADTDVDEMPDAVSCDRDTRQLAEDRKSRPDTSGLPLPTLPDIFRGKTFFLHGSFSEDYRKQVKRYITAFNGHIVEYMNSEVQFVITVNQWDETFEEALTDNPDIIFVKPKWIFACSDRQKLVPYQPFMIVPQESI